MVVSEAEKTAEKWNFSLTVEGNNVYDVPLALREFFQGFLQSDFFCGFCSDKLSPYHENACTRRERQAKPSACLQEPQKLSAYPWPRAIKCFSTEGWKHELASAFCKKLIQMRGRVWWCPGSCTAEEMYSALLRSAKVLHTSCLILLLLPSS